jgi:hypothetical protein
MKAYHNWLLMRRVHEDRLVYEKLASRVKFNNRFVAELLGGPARETFVAFLQEDAGTWIEESKIKNKNIHFDTIKEYLALANDPYLLNTFKEKCIRNP